MDLDSASNLFQEGKQILFIQSNNDFSFAVSSLPAASSKAAALLLLYGNWATLLQRQTSDVAVHSRVLWTQRA